MEQMIELKAGGVVSAKKRAESLQQEAKRLLLLASDKLQLLKGDIIVTLDICLGADKSCAGIRAKLSLTLFSCFRPGEVIWRQPAHSGGESRAAGRAGSSREETAAGDQPQGHCLQHLSVLRSEVTQGFEPVT